jgi:hypothetical protein
VNPEELTLSNFVFEGGGSFSLFNGSLCSRDTAQMQKKIMILFEFMLRLIDSLAYSGRPDNGQDSFLFLALFEGDSPVRRREFRPLRRSEKRRSG